MVLPGDLAFCLCRSDEGPPQINGVVEDPSDKKKRLHDLRFIKVTLVGLACEGSARECLGLESRWSSSEDGPGSSCLVGSGGGQACGKQRGRTPEPRQCRVQQNMEGELWRLSKDDGSSSEEMGRLHGDRGTVQRSRTSEGMAAKPVG